MENSSFPESGGDSSPRCREIEFENPPPWEDSQGNQPPSNYKVKFMCSYGGKIHPRPRDNQLSYVGGETKILSVDRSIRFAALFAKLVILCDSENILIKYQLPGEDLDALISVTNDDDLEHMMHECEGLHRNSQKPARPRVFIFPTVNQSLNSSDRGFGNNEVKSEKERFVDALNSTPNITAPPRTASPAVPPPQAAATDNDLMNGLEKSNSLAAAQSQTLIEQPMIAEVDDPVLDPVPDERSIGLDPIQKHIQDLERLRLEEQHRKTNDTLAGVFAGTSYYNLPEKSPPVFISGGGVPIQSGIFPASNENSVYMIQAPAGAYHTPVVRNMAGAPVGYYTVQRMPSEPPHMYNMVPPHMVLAAPPQKVAGYPEGFGMVRAEGGYAQVAYDVGAGRQVFYTTAAPPQYQGVGGGADMRTAGGFCPEVAGGKVVVPEVTQTHGSL